MEHDWCIEECRTEDPRCLDEGKVCRKSTLVEGVVHEFVAEFHDVTGTYVLPLVAICCFVTHGTGKAYTTLFPTTM